MRAIDNNGRLFNKINVIDFLLILFLLCLVPMFYFGYTLLTKNSGMIEQEKEFIETEIDSKLIKVKPELVKTISAGDKELNEDGQVIGEILSLGQSSSFKYEFDIGENQIISKEDPILKQIEAKLRLKAEVKENKLYYKDKEIRIGSSLEFNTNKYNLAAILIEDEEKREVILLIRHKNLEPEIAEAVKIGDEQFEIYNDVNGRKKVVAKVEKIISNEPSEVISLKEDRITWATALHPKNRDLVLEIKVMGKLSGGNIFDSKNIPLKIGLPFNFSTNEYSISGTIIGIKIKK